MNTARIKLIQRQGRTALRAALRDIYVLSAASIFIAGYLNLLAGLICLALSIYSVVRRHTANISRITKNAGLSANGSHSH